NMDNRTDLLITQYFLYERRDEGAVVLRCFSKDGKVEIPKQVDGIPVRELAPYAFSSHTRDMNVSPDALREGRIWVYPGGRNARQLLSENSVEISGIPALSGSQVKELILPSTVWRVGRYCFYDCSNLYRLEFPGTLIDWGSGAFTGCHHVEELCVHMDMDGNSCLKQVLDELPEKLRVRLCWNSVQKMAGDNTDTVISAIEKEERDYAHLVFPEFYEEGVENTPARILETHVHGSGILYRNCFQGKKFDFAQYDHLFPHAKAQEDEQLLTELVLGRLRFPWRLEERARREYEVYVREHAQGIGTAFLRSGDYRGLQWFLEHYASGENQEDESSIYGNEKKVRSADALLEHLSEYAARIEDAQAQSRIMEFRHHNEKAPVKRRRFML
ncbi:MAG: leucine-rich repeat domain-containing protein, partial [Clostridiales bacterium]|nr:leucine-rich repeat domain-containing protein [Clostridiales bacterium]